MASTFCASSALDINPAKLNIEKNQIAGSVLSDLDPILIKEAKE